MNRFALINTASEDYCIHIIIETTADKEAILNAYELSREEKDDWGTEYWDFMNFVTPFDCALDILETQGFRVDVIEPAEEVYMEW